jgi:hypothetical protein
MPTRVDYHEYMASREWRLKRRGVIEACQNTCERCAHAPVQSVHHLTYERLGDEDDADLMGVCQPCHDYLAGVTDADPALRFIPPYLYTPVDLGCVADVGIELLSIETVPLADGEAQLHVELLRREDLTARESAFPQMDVAGGLVGVCFWLPIHGTWDIIATAAYSIRVQRQRGRLGGEGHASG